MLKQNPTTKGERLFISRSDSVPCQKQMSLRPGALPLSGMHMSSSEVGALVLDGKVSAVTVYLNDELFYLTTFAEILLKTT